MRVYSDDDYKQVFAWCEKRGVPAPPRWALTSFGLIEDKVGCGFLMITDNNCGLLDFFITNPDAPAYERGCVMEQVVQGLLSAAFDIKLKMIMASTQIPSMKRMCARQGFQSVGDFATMTRCF